MNGLAELRVVLARFFAGTGDLARAEQEATQAAALLESLSHESNGATYLGELATAYHQLGYVQARRAEDDAALHSFEQAVSRSRQQLASRPDDLNEIARLSRIEADYGAQLAAVGKARDSLAVLREAQAGLERLLKRDPLNVRHRLNLVRVFNAQGSTTYSLGDYAGAVGSFSQATSTAEALLVAGPDDHANNVAAMISHQALGLSLIRVGQTAAGERRLREAIAEGESMIKAEPDDGWSLNEVAVTRLELGDTLLAGGAWNAEGCRQVGEGLRLWKTLATRAEIPAETAGKREQYEREWAACQRHGPS